jgi:hypothetical protein
MHAVNEADRLLASVRRWDINEWDLRDTAAQLRWDQQAPESDRGRVWAEEAGHQLRLAVERERPRAADLLTAYEQMASRVDQHAVDSLTRANDGEVLDSSYTNTWSAHAREAVGQALLSAVARSFISSELTSRLRVGLEAAEAQLSFSFTTRTTSEEAYDACLAFRKLLSERYGADALIDPPSLRPRADLRVSGTAWILGTDSEGQLSRELQDLLRQVGGEDIVRWPPIDFRIRRPDLR